MDGGKTFSIFSNEKCTIRDTAAPGICLGIVEQMLCHKYDLPTEISTEYKIREKVFVVALTTKAKGDLGRKIMLILISVAAEEAIVTVLYWTRR